MKKYSTTLLCIAVLTIIVAGNQIFKGPRLEAVETTPTVIQTSDKIMVPQESTSGADISENNSSDYFLPYPGILPDHPLYFIKDLRDKIIEMLIADPTRKSEFYLLQSDKWLSAGIALIAKNKPDLAKKTFIDSSQRMSMAVAQLSALKSSNGQVPAGNIDKIEKSIRKHEEALNNVTTTDVSESKTILQNSKTDVGKL